MAKDIHFGSQAREEILFGVNMLANAVEVTLGPCGRHVAIEKSFGAPLVTKDGVTVATEIQLEGSFNNLGAQMVKEAASKTGESVGDGTTTATVLARAIYREGHKLVAAGHDPMSLKRGIDAAIKTVIQGLQEQSKPSKGHQDNARIASISANNDPEIGEIIAQAMDKVGDEGVITVEEASGLETTLDFVEGMQFDRGYLSPYFVTDPIRMEAAFDDVYILIHEGKIRQMQPFLPILESVAKDGKSLLVIAEDITGEALSTLVVNKIRGSLQVCAVKAPGFGDRKKAMLQDIAILTGGKCVSEDLGMKLENLTISDLGQAKKVIIDKDNSIIISGAGEDKDIQGRISEIKAQIQNTDSEYDLKNLDERLAKLAGGVAIISVGAATEVEMKEKEARVDDAMHAAKAAVEEGVLIGGGVALLRASKLLDTFTLSPEEDFGIRIIRRALEEPLRAIAKNAGHEPAIVVNKVNAQHHGDFGFNALTGAFEDLKEAGIIDPTKVVRSALENAASAAGMLLTTEVAIAEMRKKDKHASKTAMYGDERRVN